MNTLHWEKLCFRTSPILKLYKHQLPNSGRIEEHVHDFHEIFWVTAGEGIHLINGEQMRISRGDLVWIRPFDHHFLQAAGKQALQFYNLAFPGEIVSDLTLRYEEFQYYFGKEMKQPITFALSESLQEWLDSSITGLRNRPGSRLALDRFLLNLISELSLYRANPFHNCPGWLRDALTELTRNPEHLKLGSRALAILGGRTQEHTARELRRFAGITPSQAVNRARIDYAARLLMNTDLTVTEIAFQCGFGTLSGFFPAFQEAYAMTPTQYRRLHRNSERS